MDAPLELALPMAETEPIHPVESLEPAMPVVEIEPILAAEPLVPSLPVAEVETVAPAEPLELAPPMAEIEPALPIVAIEPILADKPFEPALPVAEIETIFAAEPLELALPTAEPADSNFVIADEIPELIAPVAREPRPLVTPHVEIRSNVVEMPFTPVARKNETDQPMLANLVIPGGFHEASALARLLEEEEPFNGLAIVIGVVDYVRLMADQGKPAAEQLMGSISRLVMSLAREQDFACRIAEDEFVLLFAGETGTAAKRRIQLVSERLWDFQLRSLGSVSVIFSWGASESTKEAVVHAVEHAREQMLDSRRNRRTLASGVGRFRRRVANS
jgi:GGDEF domain-containing protein